jgi:parallel beta-helix repeat protein
MSQEKGLVKRRLASVFIIWWLIWGGFFGFLIFEKVSDDISVEAANIIVDWQGAGDYTTIQNAIDNAQPGDTVYVWAGEYKENVKVDKSVTLMGNGTSNTTINGNKNGDVIYISADWVNITGFNITDSRIAFGSAGIELNNVENCSIYNNNISNNYLGIYLVSAINNSINNNNITSNGYLGIYLTNSANDNTIANNSCDLNNYFGIYISQSNSNKIINCTCSEVWYGIYISNSDNNQIINTTCNTTNYYGLYISLSNHNTITNVTCNSNGYDGINFYSANYNVISNCTLNWNKYYGLNLRYSGYNNFFNNSMVECGIGIDGDLLEYWNSHSIKKGNFVNNKPVYYLKNQTKMIITQPTGQIILANCTNITIENYNLSKCSVGVQAGFSMNITLFNITSNNNYFGIYFYETHNNNITNCTSNWNDYHGMYLYYSEKNTITNSTCNNNNEYGIYLYYGENSIIRNSTCNQNNKYGIYIYYSSFSSIINTTCNMNKQYGINFRNSNYPTIIKSTSNKNVLYGIYLYYSWNSLITDTTSSWNGNTGLWIERGDSHRLYNNTCSNNQYGIYLNSINTITINNCTSNSNDYIGIYTWFSSSISITNSTCNFNNESGIQISRYEYHKLINNNCSNNKNGTYLDQVFNSNIFNNTFESNSFNGIYIYNSNENILEGNNFNNNSVGINLSRGGNICSIINTSISNSKLFDIHIYQNSHATALNCSLDWSKINYTDSISTLTVQWFLQAYVIDDLSVPVSDANVTVKDKDSNIIYSGLTNGFGFVRWIICNEYVEDKSGKTSTFTPHNISVTKKAHENSWAVPEPLMNESKNVYVILPRDITPPEPPSDLIFTFVSGSHINFTWTQLITDDVYGYNIYINDTGSSSKFHLFGSTNKTFFNATGLMEKTLYYFRIKSFDDVPLESTALEGFNKTFDLTPPNPPSLIKLSAFGGTYLNMTWAGSSSSDVQGYQIFVNDTGSTTDFNFLINTTFNYFNHTSLVEETVYIYLVRAYDDVPHYSINISIVATTLDITAPMPPSSLAVKNVGGYGMTLSWDPSSDSDVTGYHIFINDTGVGASGPFHKLFTLPVSTTQIIIPGLIEETTYYFTIVAFDEVPNDSVYSEVISGTTLDVTAPRAPTGLTATAISDREIDLNWDANTEQDIDGYLIYMNASGQGAWGEFHLIQMVSGMDTEYTVTGLIEQVTYYFKIKAFDEVPNNSLFSNIAYETVPDISPPSIPTGLNVSNPTNNSLKVSWEANPESDVIGYLLFRAKSISSTFISLQAEPIVNSNYIDNGLDENTTYYYKVRAIDDFDLKSGFSDIAMGKTLYGQLPPEINKSIEDFEIMEDSYDDSSINLFEWFKDVNGDKLEFECKGNKHIDVRIYDKNGTVILIPDKNWNGFEILTFIATDGLNNTTDDVMITITPVNDAPVHPEIISPEVNIELEFGIGLTFKGTCDDPDLPYGDKLTFNWYSDLSGTLGNKEIIENVILPIGDHIITMEVSDLPGEKAFVNIQVHIFKSPTYDTDGDKMPDIWESSFELNPNNPNDAIKDSDKDTLLNIDEYNNNTNPNEPDTDFDGLFDVEEILEYYTNPTNPDTDNDTYSDGEEVANGTDPLNPLENPLTQKKGVYKPSQELNVLVVIISVVIIIILILLLLIAFIYVINLRKELSHMVTKIPSSTRSFDKRKIMRPKKRKLKEKFDEDEDEYLEDEWGGEEDYEEWPEEEWEEEEYEEPEYWDEEELTIKNEEKVEEWDEKEWSEED